MNTLNLCEKYRPTDLSQFVGNPRAVAQVRLMLERGTHRGRAVWVSGPTGVGKTTLARIIARDLAESWNIVEWDAGDELTAEDLDSIARTMATRGMGEKSGRVWIVNEAHGLSGRAMRGALQRILDGEMALG